MKNTILLFLLVAFSCQEVKKDNGYEKILLGDWIRLTEAQLAKRNMISIPEDSFDIPTIPFPRPPQSLYNVYEPYGLGIYSDSLDYYKGYVKITKDSLSNTSTKQYLGNFTRYKVDKDTLKLFDKRVNNYQIFVIKKLEADTLVLQYNDTTTMTLRKLHYQLDTLQKFDKVIFSTSYCYGSCPVMNIMIDSNGEIIFQSEDYMDKKGYHKGKLPKAYTSYLFEKFTKADIRNINTSYSIGHTDDQTYTTSFIKDKRIYKTVHDYGMAAKPELIWAYIPAFFAYQVADLEKISQDSLPFYQNLRFFDFTRADSIVDVEKSEAFLLWNELRMAKSTSQSFTPRFQLGFRYLEQEVESKKKAQITSIKTDGRFFQFLVNKSVLTTLDLGYNFIEANLHNTKIRALEEWEK